MRYMVDFLTFLEDLRPYTLDKIIELKFTARGSTELEISGYNAIFIVHFDKDGYMFGECVPRSIDVTSLTNSDSNLESLLIAYMGSNYTSFKEAL